MKYSVILPVLDEVENLRILLPGLLSPECEVLVCDGGSVDGSIELVKDAIPNFNIRLVRCNGSVTQAILRGLEESTTDKVVVMDSDLSHPPEVARKVASELDMYDMVVGSRFFRGGATRDSLWNRILSGGLNYLTWGLAPQVRDRVSGLWGARKGVVSTSIRDTVKPMLEFLVRANPTSVAEVPYTFEPRVNGASKLGKPVLRTFFDIVLLYLHKFRRPLRFLLVGGLGTLIYLGILLLLTEAAGLWYLLSAVVGIFVATVWNFTMNNYWVFSKTESSESPSYEWDAWYKGNPLQRWWKRKIGYVTKTLLGDPRSLLDVGCGSSPAINLFMGYRVGIDRSQGKLDFLGRYTTASLYCADIEEGLDFPVSSFEAVMCNNVLEHLTNPREAVEGIARLLAPQGKAVMTIPDEGSLIGKVGDWLYRKFGSYGHEHISRLTAKSLDRICEGAGLDLVGSRRVLSDTVRHYVKV